MRQDSESEDTYVYEWSSFKNTWIRTEILRGEGVGNREGISLALSDDGKSTGDRCRQAWKKRNQDRKGEGL